MCGEHVYDRPLNGKPIPDGSGAARPMLHAAKLGIRHPDTEEKMSWSCSLPDDMAILLAACSATTTLRSNGCANGFWRCVRLNFPHPALPQLCLTIIHNSECRLSLRERRQTDPPLNPGNR